MGEHLLESPGRLVRQRSPTESWKPTKGRSSVSSSDLVTDRPNHNRSESNPVGVAIAALKRASVACLGLDQELHFANVAIAV
jgi:hypothetical protein